MTLSHHGNGWARFNIDEAIATEPTNRLASLTKVRDDNLRLAESCPELAASYLKFADNAQAQIDALETELKSDLEWLGGPQTISLDQLPGLLFAVALAFNPTDEWVRQCEAQILAEEAALGSAENGSEFGSDKWFDEVDEFPF